jgi:hypothetical protein
VGNLLISLLVGWTKIQPDDNGCHDSKDASHSAGGGVTEMSMSTPQEPTEKQSFLAPLRPSDAWVKNLQKAHPGWTVLALLVSRLPMTIYAVTGALLAAHKLWR